jgi:hypothetical protein
MCAWYLRRMARTWIRSAVVVGAALAPLPFAATLTQGCGGTKVEGDAGTGGGGGADAGATTTVLHPDAPPLPGQSSCDVTITTNIPVTKAIHVTPCTHVDYATNPPSGGDHWGVWAAFGSYDVPVPREMYVHDMEHGALILLHACDGACPDVVAALAQARDAVAGDPLCLQIPDGPTERVITTPDPLLDAPIAMAAWGATYTATCIDVPSLRAFAKAHYGHGTETLCAQGQYSGDAVTQLCSDAGTDAGGGAGGGASGAGGAGGGAGGVPDAG